MQPPSEQFVEDSQNSLLNANRSPIKFAFRDVDRTEFVEISEHCNISCIGREQVEEPRQMFSYRFACLYHKFEVFWAQTRCSGGFGFLECHDDIVHFVLCEWFRVR